jgi:hypothetical protein
MRPVRPLAGVILTFAVGQPGQHDRGVLEAIACGPVAAGYRLVPRLESAAGGWDFDV